MPGIDFRRNFEPTYRWLKSLNFWGLSSLNEKATRCGANVRSMNLPKLENIDPFRPISAETCSGVSSAELPATILISGPRQARNLFMKQLSIFALA